MELRHLRYLAAVAEHGTFREASRRLHVSQSAISEQIADLEHEVGGPLLDRGQRTTQLTAQGRIFLAEATRTLASAQHALDLTRRSLLGQEGSLSIGFFLWGARGFFANIIRDYRRLHPHVKLNLHEMHALVQMEAFKAGKLDVGFSRPLEPPHDRLLAQELLSNDPVVAVLPRDHPLAGRTIQLAALAAQPFVMCERQVTPRLFDSILALCATAGFTPEIVNTSTTWSGVLTLVESGEGIALVPSGVRYLRTPGLVFCPLRPKTTHAGLAVVWNPRNEGPVIQNFLKLVRASKSQLRKSS